MSLSAAASPHDTMSSGRPCPPEWLTGARSRTAVAHFGTPPPAPAVPAPPGASPARISLQDHDPRRPRPGSRRDASQVDPGRDVTARIVSPVPDDGMTAGCHEAIQQAANHATTDIEDLDDDGSGAGTFEGGGRARPEDARGRRRGLHQQERADRRSDGRGPVRVRAGTYYKMILRQHEPAGRAGASAEGDRPRAAT